MTKPDIPSTCRSCDTPSATPYCSIECCVDAVGRGAPMALFEGIFEESHPVADAMLNTRGVYDD